MDGTRSRSGSISSLHHDSPPASSIISHHSYSHHHGHPGHGHIHGNVMKRKYDISRTIRDLTSTKKRLSDSNLQTNDTIEFFTKIKNRKLKQTPLSRNPTYSKYNTYNPYDRKKLLERINSYNILNWSIDSGAADDDDDDDDDGNGNKLTPLTCARYGWHCMENNGSLKNQIRCMTCNASMVIKLQCSSSSDLNQQQRQQQSFQFFEFDEDLLENEEAEADDDDDKDQVTMAYITKLTTDHSESCPWKNHPSPLSTYQIHYYDHQEILNSLHKRINHLLMNRHLVFAKDNEGEKKQFVKRLESEELSALRKFATQQDQRQGHVMISGIEHEHEHEPETDSILTIAVLGWELMIQSFSFDQLIFLQCHCCNRRILLNKVLRNSTNTLTTNDRNDVTVSISPSKILPGTIYPASSSSLAQEEHDDGEGHDGDDNDDGIDLLDQHKNWCAMRKGYKDILQFV